MNDTTIIIWFTHILYDKLCNYIVLTDYFYMCIFYEIFKCTYFKVKGRKVELKIIQTWVKFVKFIKIDFLQLMDLLNILLCLVLLQVPKCFVLVQIFCASPKIWLHLVPLAGTKTNFTECKSSFSLAQNVCDCHDM